MANATCFAWRQENRWEALCTDFDIAVSGRSFDDVRHQLHAAIEDYLALLEQEAPNDRRRLLNRKSPLHVRAKLWAAYIVDSFAAEIWSSIGSSKKKFR